MAFKTARVIAAALLILGLNERPDLYYTALGWMVCGIAVFGIYSAMELEESAWATIFGIIALLYNPLYPIELAYSTASLVHIGTATIMMTSIPTLGAKEQTKEREEQRNATILTFRHKKRI
ncbi:MAG: DUF6804 family protein [Candidatus Latescibacterota bacterium]